MGVPSFQVWKLTADGGSTTWPRPQGKCGSGGGFERIGVPKGSRAPAVFRDAIKREKGVGWMPWRQEAMKDVALCDKLRGGESDL